MSTLIMNIVEWSFVAGIFLLGVFPFLTYWNHCRTFKHMGYHLGEIFQSTYEDIAQKRLMDGIGTLSILFFLAGVFPKVALAMAILLFSVMVCLYIYSRAQQQAVDSVDDDTLTGQFRSATD